MPENSMVHKAIETMKGLLVQRLEEWRMYTVTEEEQATEKNYNNKRVQFNPRPDVKLIEPKESLAAQKVNQEEAKQEIKPDTIGGIPVPGFSKYMERMRRAAEMRNQKEQQR